MNYDKYKKYGIYAGWTVFLISFITYFLTVEPTVSFWDCGEFIASSYKLEVGHPPGAPFFMLLARFFSLFALSPQNAAFMINMVSVTASAFTVMFLFWTIMYFAEKILIKKDNFNKISAYAVLLSAATGSLFYAFSDTFWFSAVEAEVYASSSLFTAVVFWAILKWEQISNQKHSDRWLIFIALVMGISIGVHLLNLLTIPALVFVYYFKKYKTTKKGIFHAAVISVVILGFIMYGIIRIYVVTASKFELLFVNSFGLPYNSGLLFFLFASFGGLIFGIIYTFKKKKPILNMIFTAVTVILIGYSSFAIIVIRSYANPPMDENNPENIFALLSYLNREQYGSRPLLYGNYYNAEFQKDENGEIKFKRLYTYIPENGKYLKIEKTNPEYLFEPSGKTIFPRMYSRDKNHIAAYKSWAGIEDGENPNFFHNLKFFFKYQLGHMYFRYFMWNFAGRQNNLQSYGGITKGNWISGIPFIDKAITGNQKNLPDKIKNDKSRNTYYLLPFILGIIGLLFSYSKDKKNFLVIALLFFFTGIAIVIYLNQTPYQPRERDYAYAGSFYAFSVWLGLGSAAIFSYLAEKTNKKTAIIIASLLTLPVPVITLAQNYDDHDRSNRYTARDFAEDYLNSCDKNAVLFTYGDNDTFPLWYLQEVEGVRTDVKVVNLSLLGTDWYIDQIKRRTYDAPPAPFKMTHDKYREGKRDVIYITENNDIFINEKYETEKLKYEQKFNEIKNELVEILSKSRFPKLNPDIYKDFIDKKDSLTVTQIQGTVTHLNSKDFIEKFDLNADKIENLFEKINSFVENISKENLPLDLAMDFVASESENTQLVYSKNNKINYLPSKKLSLKVSWPQAAKNGTFTANELSKFQKYIKWKLDKSYIFKNDMAVLEILARNNWKRPIYFATSVPSSFYNGLKNYLRLDGFALRLVPFKTNKNNLYINSDVLYDMLMNKAVWGNMNKKNVNVDNFVKRSVRIMNIRGTFVMLADKLIKEGKKEKALKVLDKCIEIMPDYNFTYDIKTRDIAEMYYKLGKKEKANEIAEKVLENSKQYLKYYKGFEGDFKYQIMQDETETTALAKIFADLCFKYEQQDLYKKFSEILEIEIKR